jgi:7,8-dihydropterin-6-yl-methyl-4-(beta-D-ribofuranosyl)aminobenzene 5'-phosphate synthase
MIHLKTVDRVEVLSIMDNSIDVLMGNTPVAQRPPRDRNSFSRPQLRAEHGVSMLVTTYENGAKDSFLFDTGVTIDGVLHNMDALEIKPNTSCMPSCSATDTRITRGA